MKLFGTSRYAARVAGRGASKNKSSKGGIVALIILSAVALLLIGLIVVMVLRPELLLRLFSKAPDVTGPGSSATEIIDPDTGKQVEQTDPNQSEQTPGEPVKVPKEGYYNILIAGTDNDGFRTDTLMIARLDTVNHTVALLSIPRDSLVETSAGVTKINSIYGIYGCGANGMESLLLEVEDILGFKPNGYAFVNLNAFVELVDLVGGVYYDVPQDMYHVDPTQDLYIDLKAGYQHLDGNEAMQLVRFRGYDAADIERTHVQQKFLTTLAKQCMSITNLTKIKDYCDIFANNVSTNYTASNLLYFVQELNKCDLSTINTYTLPGNGGYYVDGIDYYYLDSAAVKEIVDKDFYPFTIRED